MQHVNDVLELLTPNDYSTDQYLSFTLADENYGVDILRVQEIKGWERVTLIPNAPHYVRGVFNLRGTIIPVVDLRRRFDMPIREYTPRTVVVMLKVEGLTERTVGVVVDGVSDTYTVAPESIKPAPDLGGCVETEFIKGLVSLRNDMLMILNIDRLLSVEALG
ncbi:chemotaxis protein CheW [Pseudomonadota bacterium]|nr:chemotaxis protein CheW [Pseudomonadota bacterium]